MDLGERNWDDLIRQAPPTAVAETLISVLNLIKPATSADESLRQKLRTVLQHLVQPNVKSNPDTKKAKAGPPPKKKAPPGKGVGHTQALIVSSHFPIFWPVTTGQPTDATFADEAAAAALLKHSRGFSFDDLSAIEVLQAPAASIYDIRLLEGREDILKAALNVSRVDIWFKKSTMKRVNVKDKKLSGLTRRAEVRPSALGAVLSQRIGILLFSLKKSLPNRATLDDVKRALLSCSLEKDLVALLADTIPNASDATQMRKYEEWQEAEHAVASLRSAEGQSYLLEDEEFVYFLGQIPNIHRRLACMYVTAEFKSIAGTLESKMKAIRDGLHLILKSGNMHVLWQLLLALGNKLNEDTPRAKLLWFKLSGLRRALDVRGTDGMSIPEYLSAFVGPIFSHREWKILLKAREAGLINTYLRVRDLLDTYTLVNGGTIEDEDANTISCMTRDVEGIQDEFTTHMRDFAEKNFTRGKELCADYIKFVRAYILVSYFYGDPTALLPLDSAELGDPESEDSPARDLLTRILYFLEPLRRFANCKQGKQRIKNDGTWTTLSVNEDISLLSNYSRPSSSCGSDTSEGVEDVENYHQPQMQQSIYDSREISSYHSPSPYPPKSVGLLPADVERRMPTAQKVLPSNPPQVQEAIATRAPLLPLGLSKRNFSMRSRLGLRLPPRKTAPRNARGSIEATFSFAREQG